MPSLLWESLLYPNKIIVFGILASECSLLSCELGTGGNWWLAKGNATQFNKVCYSVNSANCTYKPRKAYFPGIQNQSIECNNIFFFPCTGSCVVDAPSLLKHFIWLCTKMVFNMICAEQKKVNSRVRSRIHLNLQLWICHEDANFDSVIWNQLIHNQTRWILIWGLFHLQVFNPECLIWDFVWIIWKYFSILNWCTTTLLDNTN